MHKWANICIMKLFDVRFEKSVVENVFLCSVAAITFEYICYPDRLRPEKSYAMETDYKRARTLCFVDVMSVIFSMYIIYIVVFSFGVSPYLLCDFALAKEMSAKRRIYSHWLLMVFFFRIYFTLVLVCNMKMFHQLLQWP